MGTMGSGKTTVARLLSQGFGYHLIEENFGENAFLPRFYRDMPRWAFHSQTFFLMEKITQMLDTTAFLKTVHVVQDTPIQQDVFSYAKAQMALGHMDTAEWKLYQKIYTSFEPYFPVPDLIVYLEASLPVLLERIGKRGRAYEEGIDESYVALLDSLNREWLKDHPEIPVLRIDVDTRNVVHRPDDRKAVLSEVQSGVAKGKVV